MVYTYLLLALINTCRSSVARVVVHATCMACKVAATPLHDGQMTCVCASATARCVYVRGCMLSPHYPSPPCCQVLCHVSVQGKGYCHPDGRVAVSHLRLNAFMEYLPKGPSDKVVALRYDRDGTHTLQTSSSSSLQAVQHGGLAAAAQAPMAGSTVLQLTPELQEVAWDVEAS